MKKDKYGRMMTGNMIEREKTYLAKQLPEGLEKCEKKEIYDLYLPKEHPHPKIRIRKNGNKFEITKKKPISGEDASHHHEHTIHLNEAEFNSLKKLPTKDVRKVRYFYPFNGRTAEIDVFQDALKGLVLVDFEFQSKKEMNNFEIPKFCLADVTQEEFIAGGMLCGKSYENIEKELDKFGYKRI